MAFQQPRALGMSIRCIEICLVKAGVMLPSCAKINTQMASETVVLITEFWCAISDVEIACPLDVLSDATPSAAGSAN